MPDETRKQANLPTGLWWLAAGLVLGAMAFLLPTTLAPKLLLGAAGISICAALVVRAKFESCKRCLKLITSLT